MKIYKKVRQLNNGEVKPLFIGKTKPFKFGEWMHCEYIPTNGFMERSIGKDKNGNEIGGWHGCYLPIAPHISDELKNGERRIWIECEAKGIHKKYKRPESQGGTWCLYEWIKPLRILSDDDVREIILHSKYPIQGE